MVSLDEGCTRKKLNSLRRRQLLPHLTNAPVQAGGANGGASCLRCRVAPASRRRFCDACGTEESRRDAGATKCLSSGEFLDQGLAQFFLMFGREFSGRGGEVEDVDGGLALGVDQGDVNIAFLLGENGADAIQQAGLILRNDLD